MKTSTLTFCILLHLLFPMKLIAGCTDNIDLSTFVPDSCLNLNDVAKTQSCIKETLPQVAEVKVFPTAIEIELRGPQCLNSIHFVPIEKTLLVTFDSHGKFKSVLNFKGTVQIERYAFNNRNACGFGPNGAATVSLSPTFSYIPKAAKIYILEPRCRKTLLESSLIALAEDTIICGLKMSRDTSFFISPDGAYHFVAKSNGHMTANSDNGSNYRFKITKGKDYRNMNPTEKPCKWEETPADVLKSFNEERSE